MTTEKDRNVAPKLIYERRFGEAHQLLDVFTDVIGVLDSLRQNGLPNVAYVKSFGDSEGGGAHASLVRVWEEVLTDGSKVYELHIL